jgi:hypothetical protein
MEDFFNSLLARHRRHQVSYLSPACGPARDRFSPTAAIAMATAAVTVERTALRLLCHQVLNEDVQRMVYLSIKE